MPLTFDGRVRMADFKTINVDLIRREAEIELMTKKEKKEAGIA